MNTSHFIADDGHRPSQRGVTILSVRKVRMEDPVARQLLQVPLHLAIPLRLQHSSNNQMLQTATS